MKLLPRSEWDAASHTLIFHGRRVCFAQKPNCEGCPVKDACPSAFRAENVGRKPPRPPRVAGGAAKKKAATKVTKRAATKAKKRAR